MDTEVLRQLELTLAPIENVHGHAAHGRYTTNRQAYKRVLVHNAPFVFTCDKENRIVILKNHSVEVEDDVITKVAPAETCRPSRYDLVYDAGKRGGTVITPGLINTHAHPPMYLMRSAMMLDEGEGIEETIAVMPTWERALDEYESAIATIGDITEQQKYGITTTLSHYGVFYPIEYAATITGQHIVNALSAASNTHPENTPELIQTLVSKRTTFQSEVAASLHYLYKASPEVLKKICNLVQAHNILFTCHLAESKFVAQECVRVHGMREVEVLKHYGLLNSNTVVSHVIHVDDEDIELLRKHRVGISHLPTSNIIHKSGRFPFWKFAKDDVGLSLLSLGTDSVVSKSRLDILTEAYQTRITHLYEKTVKFGSLFKMMTSNGAQVLQKKPTGKILPGMQADIAFWKLRDRGFLPYDEHEPITLLGNIITHGGRVVRDLMIAGKFVIKDREHQLVNETALLNCTQTAHMQMRAKVERNAPR